MGMKIVLSGFPDKHHVKREHLAHVLDANPADCYFETSIYHLGHDNYEVECRVLLGMISALVPAFSKPTCSRAEMLAICMEAAPGDADEWIRDLLPAEDAEYVIRHYYTSKSHSAPDSLRA